MAFERIDPDPTSKSYQRARQAFNGSAGDNRLKQFQQIALRAQLLPGGHIKKIVWDKEGGYPEHAWGYTQYTLRPYQQGYGCDGTTDDNIHLIAKTLCERIGIDYLETYQSAYPDSNDGTRNWLDSLPNLQEIVEETVMPDEATNDTLMLVLSDLYQINNRSLVAALEDRMEQAGFSVRQWYMEEDRLKGLEAREARGHGERARG